MPVFVAKFEISLLTLISPLNGSYGLGKYWIILYNGIVINRITLNLFYQSRY